MGLLTAPQIAAMPGARIAHKYELLCKYYSSWSSYTTNVLHDDTASPPVRGVLSHGSISNSVGNISPKCFGDIETMRCEITVSNSGDRIYREGTYSADGIFYTTAGVTHRMVYPSEARLKHSVYMMVAGSWSELPCSPWIGRVQDVIYSDDRKEATIIADALAAVELREPWNIDHAYDSLVSDAYVPSGFKLSNVTTGITAGGDLWLQATSSEVCTVDGSGYSAGVATFHYFYEAGDNEPSADVTSTGSLHRFEDTSAPGGWGAGKPCGIGLRLIRASDSKEILFYVPEIPLVWQNQSAVARPW